ncbi:hypothetical protein G647_08850 [Cladophialophora carrionii CBS 160.54]|uniref:Uncharacterized protein n=1 Tax=Cladophialophora carrionii CBS 160.54 TaxID=1279043 RepID=V9CZK8_9EURO|nr:uncharacterized protein G647_08850 [Cladophialophora carrionii CBS 160.54]ETI19836.1 hypothetical protein G647_08850 [Cladophialophora carrionii CBS 160.54]
MSALILSLSQERIKSRMRLALGRPPAHNFSRGRTDEQKLTNTLTRMRAEASTPVAKDLVRRISALTQRFEEILGPDKPLSTHEMKEVVNESFSITTSDGALPFRTTLKHAGLNCRKWFNNKFIMQIDKLAAYHRIPDTLARAAYRKATRPLFSSIKIEYIEAYQSRLSPVSLTGKKVECHVHAEVQLVIHYLQSAKTLPPRFIGSSKGACFLCHLLIVEHGSFAVSTWHGRLFDQWTIPDLAEYTPKSVATLRAIIQRMHDKASRLRTMPHPRRPYPLTSRHNLQNFPKFSPATTILTVKHASQPSVIQPISPNHDAPRDSPDVVDFSEPLPTLSTAGLDKEATTTDGSETPMQRSVRTPTEDIVAPPAQEHSVASNLTSSDEWWESGSSKSTITGSSARPVRLLPNVPRFAAVTGLEIMAEIQSPAVGMMTLKTNDSYDSSGCHVIRVEELDAGREVTFDRRDNEPSIILRFQEQERLLCCVILEWA